MEKIIKISGMACKHCKSSVINGLSELDGVESVEINLDDGSARITLSKEIDDKLLCDKIYELGFDAEM